MHEKLRGYPVVIEIPVFWGDMDAMRHVNNTVYLRYFESARIALFERLGYLDVMEQTGVGPILGSICLLSSSLTICAARMLRSCSASAPATPKSRNTLPLPRTSSSSSLFIRCFPL